MLRVQAQQPPNVVLRVSPMTQGEAASNTRLAIQVEPGGAIAAKSFIRIRGLPSMVALSEGHAIASGVWAVPLAALPNLAIVLPTGLQGRWDIAISLVGVDGAMLAEARTVLVVVTVPAGPGAGQAPPSAKVGIARVLTAPENERALGFHTKGQEQLERGNIYAARRFFERAAEIGLAQSALALADTFDPNELARRKVVGIEPDVAAARRWYEKARELGAAEASDRLQRLGSR